MKKIFQLAALLMLCFLGACSEDALDGLSGKYDMNRYTYTKVVEQSTDKLGKGIKRLNILLESENGGKWVLHIASKDWILPGGVYQVQATESTEAGTLYGTVEDNELVSGKLEVTLLNDIYYLDGLFQGRGGKQYSCDYKGTISFEIGVDDPEASGYTAILTVSSVPVMGENNQPTGEFVPGVSKYSFAVSDPDGNGVAQFDLVNRENLAVEALAGSYSVTGTSDPGSMDAGNAFPAAWGGWSWGSYFVDKNTKQYIAGGTLGITVATGMEGETLLSFSGKGLDTTLGMDATGSQVPGTATDVDIRFVTVSQTPVQ